MVRVVGTGSRNFWSTGQKRRQRARKLQARFFSISDDNAISRALVGRVFTWYWQNCGPRALFDQIALDNP